MAGDPYAKVTTGQPLQPAAEAWNTLMDLAVKAGDAKLDQPAAPLREHYQHAKVLNGDETPIARHKVLTISAPALTPTANLSVFSSRLVLAGVVPAVGDQNLAVTLEPIQDGFIGRCIVSGIAPALVNVTNALHRAAAPNASTTLQSAARGPCDIVWKPAGTGTLLCLVRLRGGRPHGDTFAVICNIDGGSAGNATTTCSYTYEVSDLYGVIIGTGKTPEKRRYPQTPYTTTPEDSPGLAYYAVDGSLHLFDANEMAETEECPGESLVGDGITFDIAAGIAGTLRELT